MHSTVFIDEYANTAGWISAVGVTIAWIGITCILLVCCLLILRDKRYIGLIAVAAFGAFSFDGLGHYSLQPVSAHASIINITVWIEVVTAWIVLLIITGLIVKKYKQARKQYKNKSTRQSQVKQGIGPRFLIQAIHK
jgi:membrane-bound acyltransferase YfiQ involved in biofilm formation